MIQSVKHTLRKHGWIYATVFACMMLLAPNAYAAENLMEAMLGGPAALLNYLLIPPLVSLIQDVLAPFLSYMLRWGTDWFDIPYLNTIILWLQGLAIVAAVIIRVYVGIKSGILQDGGSHEYTIEEYFGKSLLAIIAIGIMPTACRLIIIFGEAVFNYVVNNTGGIDEALAWLDFSQMNPDALAADDSFASLWLVLMVLVLVIMALGCGYQFVRRQIEMLVVCIIAPIVSVYAATDESSAQAGDLLRSLLGLVLQQFLQYMLVCIALNFGNAWMQVVAGAGASASTDMIANAANATQMFMACIATFFVAMSIPRLVDRYTFGSGGSRMGGLIASQAIMTARMGLLRGLRR